MNEDKYLKESVTRCVEHFMKQDEEAKERIVTGLFEYVDRLINENIFVQAMNDKEKQEWFNSEVVNLANELKERIDRALEYIEIMEYNESYGKKYVDYHELIDILKGDN